MANVRVEAKVAVIVKASAEIPREELLLMVEGVTREAHVQLAKGRPKIEVAVVGPGRIYTIHYDMAPPSPIVKPGVG